MATFTMTASFLGAATPAIRSPAPQRRLVVSASSKSIEVASSSGEKKQESNNGRRDLMFAAAAAAMCSVAGIALADDEPKRGTAEAKKKYAPICVTMPTARICRN